MSDLMKAFRKIDLNGDGYITVQELHKTLTKVQINVLISRIATTGYSCPRCSYM